MYEMKNLLLFVVILLSFGSAVSGQDDAPPATIVNDEGGPISITGSVTYTDPFFTAGVAQPVIILEDQAGFVDRNTGFLMPTESQTLGQITSNFFESPFTYSITLPTEPKGTLCDVDNDEDDELGVQIFAIAYWTNTFGDPYLEERDLYGGGWSTAYASTRVSTDADMLREIVGGTFLVYAPDDEQAFPSEFGDDGLLFTGDEAVVTLPQGYTLVNLDTTPFTFDRSAEPVVDLIEGEAAADDFSDLSYSEAFDAMLDKMRREYAFTEYKKIDWEALGEEFRPRFVDAEEDEEAFAYRVALRDFLHSIPDGHIGGVFIIEEVYENFGAGLGMVVRELDGGRVIVTQVLPDTPAEEAGIEVGAEILSVDGEPIDAHVSAVVTPFGPFSTKINERLEQLRWALRFPQGSEVNIGYSNPGEDEAKAVLEAVPEFDSYYASLLTPETTGFELPLEYELLDNGFGYVKIYSFFDNSLLTVQLWERMIETLIAQDTPGLIIDMRQNGGGSGFLADQMAAYFFDEPHVLGRSFFYDRESDAFITDPNSEGRFFLPPENLRYHGDITVLVGPDCYSACEFFTYDMTVEERATVVGQYPTGGLGGGIQAFYMPEGETVQFTVSREVDAEGNIHIEGKGVVPSVRVPVDEETVLGEGDPVLDAAIEFLGDL
jgi:C-terminal processing protease CtpA/Prc